MPTPTVDIIAASIAAYEYNAGIVSRSEERDPDTGVLKFSNESLILNNLGFPQPNVPSLDITPEIKQRAQRDRDTFIDNTFLSILSYNNANDKLKNFVSSFSKTMYDMASRDTILKADLQRAIRIFVFLPRRVEYIYHKELNTDALRKLQSNHFGKPGELLNLELTVLYQTYLPTNGVYVTYAKDDADNLFTWYKDAKFAKDERIKIRAKVKKLGNHYQTDTPLTFLNFVKIKS